MALAESEGASPGPVSLSSSSRWIFVWATFAVVAAMLFAYNGYKNVDETQRELRLIPWLPYDQRVDFGYFFAGADMAWHGDAAYLYPRPGELTFYPEDPIFAIIPDDYAKAQLLARGNYYNPPLLAFIEAPLTELSFRGAYWLFSALAIACLGVFSFAAWRAHGRIGEMPFLIVGCLTFRPVHEAIIMGHTTLFFVLALTLGFLALRAGKPTVTGLCFSILALKPQWAVLPALFLLARREWRAFFVMGVCSSVIFVSGFLITGLDSFKNYVHFLRQQSGLDLNDAPHMFSWNGFLFKLYGAAGSHALIYGLVGLTVLPLLIVWWGRDYYLGVAATVVAMLLVSTHSVWYDWGLLIVAALFLVLRTNLREVRVEVWVVLLALYLTAGQSMTELLYPDRHAIDWHRAAFYPITPVAFGALVWMATVTWREGLLVLPTRASLARWREPIRS